MARRFGVSLEAILPTPEMGAAGRDEPVTRLRIDEIELNPHQPRSRIDEAPLRDLSASISAQGVVQPIVVRRREEGGYWLVAGERRLRATKLAGNNRIPAVIRELSSRDAVAVALVENIQREDLSAIDEARSVRRLIAEFGLTHDEAGTALGRSRSAISNLLRLLDLGQDVQEMITDGRLEMGHARALLPLEPDAQKRCADEVVARGLTVRKTEALVRQRLRPVERRGVQVARAPAPSLPDRWRDRVVIVHTRKGTTVRLRGLAPDELGALLSWLRSPPSGRVAKREGMARFAPRQGRAITNGPQRDCISRRSGTQADSKRMVGRASAVQVNCNRVAPSLARAREDFASGAIA